MNCARRPRQPAVDIACEPDMDTLVKLFKARMESEKRALAELEENVVLPFLSAGSGGRRASGLSLLRITPSIRHHDGPC